MAKMIKVLTAYIYKNPLFSKCSNGGISEKYDEVYYETDEGIYEVPEDTPNLVKFEKGAFDTIHAVPYKDVPEGKVGWSMGGSFVGDSDGRFERAIQKATGSYFYGAVALHDRCETQAEYDAMSD